MPVGTNRSPVTVIILSIVTCGIYSIYWHYVVGKEVNAALGKEAVNPMLVLVSLICAPVLFYFIYTLDKAMIELAEEKGKHYSSNFALWIVCALLAGVGIYIEMMQVQSTLNDIWDAAA
ncbi:MAG: DUF4234 domain-containing protein [Oscillospiraceae bacterium]|nr:DUF4234 domain-containing protein [Oscillospiraceae bacterium]